jgi:hypothetical protein
MRPFELSDLAELNSWYRARGDQPISIELLPPTGFIEPGVAAGFLYLTNSSLALIEGFVSNPAASSEARHQALSAITAAILDLAETRSASVVAFIADESIKARAVKAGLKHIQDYGLFRK